MTTRRELRSCSVVFAANDAVRGDLDLILTGRRLGGVQVERLELDLTFSSIEFVGE